MKRAAAILAVFVSSFAFAASLACQPEEPRTPPNSPLPEVDKKSEPPSAPPPLADGGSTSTGSSSTSPAPAR